MNEIELLVIPDAGQSFRGNDFRSLCLPCVYLFMKEGLPIYIGASSSGISRPAQRGHRQSIRALKECDEVRIHPCKSIEAAFELESILIAKCQPKYNNRKLYTGISEQLGLKRIAMTYPQASEGLRTR